jgi:hypothetical protein
MSPDLAHLSTTLRSSNASWLLATIGVLYAIRTLMNMGTLARKVQTSWRHEALTFYHHAAVAVPTGDIEAQVKKAPQLVRFMATSWLSIARHDEAIDNSFASWDMDEAIETNGLVVA